MTDIPLLEAKLRKALDMPKSGLIWYYRVGCYVAKLTEASEYGAGCVDDVALRRRVSPPPHLPEPPRHTAAASPAAASPRRRVCPPPRLTAAAPLRRGPVAGPPSGSSPTADTMFRRGHSVVKVMPIHRRCVDFAGGFRSLRTSPTG
jgi:hypothetical protein